MPASAPSTPWRTASAAPSTWRTANAIGLGERSARKSHYPELRARIAELERAQRALRFLAEAGATVSSSLDVDTTLGNFARVALPELGDVCVVYWRGRSGALTQKLAVERADARGLARAPSDFALAEPMASRVLEKGRAELVADVAEAAQSAPAEDARHCHALLEAGVASLLVVPYCAGPRTSGVLLFAMREGSGRRHDMLDLAVARQLTQRLAMAIENARLYAEAQEANRLEDDFLAIVSHELCTPLTSILGWVDRGRAGLGLGLAIVRHIVELHDGEVHVASEGEGRGAVFTVVLPLARGDDVPERRTCGSSCRACLDEPR